MKQFIHKVVISHSPLLPLPASVDLEITLQTLCVNIAYNVTLNMQICTAQHLISHLSVKVPSVRSPGGPGLMSEAETCERRERGEEE